MCELHTNDETGGPTGSIGEFVDELIVALTNSRIYWNQHPRVLTSIAGLEQTLEARCVARETDRLVLGAAQGYLFHDQRPLLGVSLAAHRLLEPLDKLGAGGIALKRGCSEIDFLALIGLISPRQLPVEDWQEANLWLEREGSEHVRLAPPFRSTLGGSQVTGGEGGEGGLDGELGPGLAPLDQQGVDFDLELGRAARRKLQVPVELYQGVVDAMQDVMVRATRGESIDIAQSQGFVESILKQLDEDSASILSLGRYDRYDAFTFGHSIRVAFLALEFAKSMTREPDVLQRIGLAALMHDVGKAKVPFEILHSTKRLSNEEREAMNEHSAHGGRLLIELAAGDPLSVAAAFGHHKTLDRGGYPSTVHDAELSVCTRMVKICDVFEALTAVRPYKDRMSPLRAYRIMMSMQDHFDLRLLRRFVEVIGLYPIGSAVKLSTGDPACVVRQTRDIRRPVVRVDEEEARELAPGEYDLAIPEPAATIEALAA